MKKYLIVTIPLSVLIIGTLAYFLLKPKTDLEIQLGAVTYQTVNWTKPTTDKDWAEDVKAEQLNIRLDFQLQQMKENLEDKILRVQKPLYDKALLYSDAIKYEYVQQGIEEPELTKQVNERIAQYKFEYEKMAQSIERINKEIDLRKRDKVDRTNDILSAKPSTEQEKIEIQKLKTLKGIK